MYVFTIETNKEEYKKYNGLQCFIPRVPIREDGFVEVYVPSTGEYILLRPSELID
jgi:hypothetical protein